jgi:hypothetical protein
MAAAKKRSVRLTKVIDSESLVRCAVGVRLIREEVWQDASGKTVRFNLAFLNPWLSARDNGRVLGYDTALGHLHRHFGGEVQVIPAEGYDKIRSRFINEVAALKRRETL